MKCLIINSPVQAIITGVTAFIISPRKVTLVYTDETTESRVGKHSFKNTDDFNPFACTSWVQEAKNKKGEKI